MRTEVLEDLIQEIQRDFNESVILPAPISSIPLDLPLPLQVLYRKCNGGDLLFGSLFKVDELIEASVAQPFSPNWIVFGSGGPIFWLCARHPSEGLWFTSWDHDSDTDIDGAVYPDIETFLKKEYEERLQQTNRAYLIIDFFPPTAKLAIVNELKKFYVIGSMELVRLLSNVPIEITFPNALEAKMIAEKLRALGVIVRIRIDYFSNYGG